MAQMPRFFYTSRQKKYVSEVVVGATIHIVKTTFSTMGLHPGSLPFFVQGLLKEQITDIEHQDALLVAEAIIKEYSLDLQLSQAKPKEMI